MRTILDRKPNWAGLLKRTVLSIPEAYTRGTIAVTTGSPVVTGNGTGWPVSDVVNTVIIEEIKASGTYWVTPASVTGITKDSLLYVDAAGPFPEIVAVKDILQGHVLLTFNYAHAAQATATASSLSSRQLRVNAVNPVFTVSAVISPISLVLDNPWGQLPYTGMGYQILLMYTTFAPDVKDLLVVTDPVQQISMRLHVSQEEINMYDPNRTATDSPQAIVDLGPNQNGNMLYEIYPPQSTAWQLTCLYHCQWPDMRLPGDTPPPFITPNILIYGALADAFATPCPRPPDFKDPFLSLDAAQRFSAMFEQAVIDCMNADESKYQKAFTWNYGLTFGSASMGANFLQSHDTDAMMGNY
jgi:hypothetical protein